MKKKDNELFTPRFVNAMVVILDCVFGPAIKREMERRGCQTLEELNAQLKAEKENAEAESLGEIG